MLQSPRVRIYAPYNVYKQIVNLGIYASYNVYKQMVNLGILTYYIAIQNLSFILCNSLEKYTLFGDHSLFFLSLIFITINLNRALPLNSYI